MLSIVAKLCNLMTVVENCVNYLFSAKTVCENLKNIASWVLLIIWAETPRYSFTLSSAGITRKKSFAELSISKLIISLNFGFFQVFWCFFVPNTSSVLLLSALAYQAEVGFLSMARYFEKDVIMLIYKSFLDNVPTLVYKQGRVENQNLAYRVGVLVENRSLKLNRCFKFKKSKKHFCINS